MGKARLALAPHTMQSAAPLGLGEFVHWGRIRNRDDPNRWLRRPLRLERYDYSQPGGITNVMPKIQMRLCVLSVTKYASWPNAGTRFRGIFRSPWMNGYHAQPPSSVLC
jgi:hypothetical protein